MNPIHDLALAKARVEQARTSLLKAERAWKAATKAMNGSDWRRLLDRIKSEEIRIATAPIIWWDYFGERLGSERWDDLDDYLEESLRRGSVDLDQKRGRVRFGLIECWHPKHIAMARAKRIPTQQEERAGMKVVPINGA